MHVVELNPSRSLQPIMLPHELLHNSLPKQASLENSPEGSNPLHTACWGMQRSVALVPNNMQVAPMAVALYKDTPYQRPKT
jgi:hypothetical protein